MTTHLQDFLLEEKQLVDISNIERKKHLQKVKIIKHLFLNGSTSNAEICNRFNISLPTSMALINQLLSSGIVVKTGQGKSEGGRKPDLYGLKEKSFFVLSIHIKRFKIKIAVIDNNHTIIEEETLQTEISPNSNIVELLHEKSQSVLKKSKINQDNLLGIGISMPGLVQQKVQETRGYSQRYQECLPG